MLTAITHAGEESEALGNKGCVLSRLSCVTPWPFDWSWMKTFRRGTNLVSSGNLVLFRKTSTCLITTTITLQTVTIGTYLMLQQPL